MEAVMPRPPPTPRQPSPNIASGWGAGQIQSSNVEQPRIDDAPSSSPSSAGRSPGPAPVRPDARNRVAPRHLHDTFTSPLIYFALCDWAAVLRFVAARDTTAIIPKPAHHPLVPTRPITTAPSVMGSSREGRERMSRCNRGSRSNGMDHPSVRITISNGPDHPSPPVLDRDHAETDIKKPSTAAEFTTHLIPQPPHSRHPCLPSPT